MEMPRKRITRTERTKKVLKDLPIVIDNLLTSFREWREVKESMQHKNKKIISSTPTFQHKNIYTETLISDYIKEKSVKYNFPDDFSPRLKMDEEL